MWPPPAFKYAHIVTSQKTYTLTVCAWLPIWLFRSCALPPTLFPWSWLECSWRVQEWRHASLRNWNTCSCSCCDKFSRELSCGGFAGCRVNISASCPSSCKEMQLAFWRIWASNLYYYLYAVKWTLCFSALLSLHPHVKRRCCLRSTVYSLSTHVVNRTRTVLLRFSNVNQWHLQRLLLWSTCKHLGRTLFGWCLVVWQCHHTGLRKCQFNFSVRLTLTRVGSDGLRSL